jgi:asparagine synthase (glutamine-hydrolysing)
MSGIFGIFQRDGTPVAEPTLGIMRRSMAHWGPDGSSIWRDGPAGLGQLRLFSTPESGNERLPYKDKSSGVVFTAAARVDNRAELGHLLNISPQEQAELPDSEFLLRAYLRWGEQCAVRIFGDWAFAAWHPAEHKLFLARDHFGNTSLFYHCDPHVFAYASCRQALLDLNLTPVKLDELYLAQLLISWTAYHGERTIHKPIRRLPPAHTLTVTANQMDVRQYWRLEDVGESSLPRREDYTAAFTEVFDEAVRCRLRSCNGSPVAVTLSGGLDSGAVTATAAGLLRNAGQRLEAFTSVPLDDPTNYVADRFGDELPLAEATARFTGNVELHTIDAAAISPIQAIRRMLPIHVEPAHGAGNAYWILELEQAAQAHGCRVLLTGQMGNAGISWTGDLSSQHLAFQIRHLGAQAWLQSQVKQAKHSARRSLPGLAAGLLRRRLERERWWRLSAIHPDFARRLRLLEQMLEDPNELPPRSPREKRYRILLPGRSLGGGLHAQMGAAHGLEIRDPTADVRVLQFTLSVPDHIFMDPKTGLDRWLIREAMKGRIPDEVRLNRSRGRQAGDLAPRLRACATEVESTLDELSRGPAAEYVDVSYMRDVWTMVQTRDTPEALRKSVTVLTRGIMAGLFVNQFDEAKQIPNDEPKILQSQMEAVS